MQKKKPEIVDTFYNPITRRYEVLEEKKFIKPPKKPINILLGVFAFVALIMVLIHLYIQVNDISKTAWRLGCVDGGLKPAECIKIQELEKRTTKL